MTTNKPEVLGYCVKKDRGRWERPNSYYLSPNPDENYTVPVISLSDYESLQAELERELQRRFDGNEMASREHREDVSALVEALEGIMRVEARDRIMPVGAEWDAARAALAAYRQQGGGE